MHHESDSRSYQGIILPFGLLDATGPEAHKSYGTYDTAITLISLLNFGRANIVVISGKLLPSFLHVEAAAGSRRGCSLNSDQAPTAGSGCDELEAMCEEFWCFCRAMPLILKKSTSWLRPCIGKYCRSIAYTVHFRPERR